MERTWLIALRNEKKMTQEQVAAEPGISRPYYTTIETGTRGVQVPTAKKIAAALGFEWQRFYEESEAK